MMKTKKVVQIVSIAGLLTGFGVTGQAQDQNEGDQMEKPDFEVIDRNSDGNITATEASNTWLAAEFASVDTDRNGQITKSEYDQAVS